MSTQPGPQDVVPTNGPPKYKFTLATLHRTQLTNWPPREGIILREAEIDLKQFWDFLSSRQIWAPYPIRAYSLASASYRDDKLLASYFLFPVEKSTVQNQAVAQLVCKFGIDGEEVTAKLAVDALDESELTEENIADIRSVLGAAPSQSATKAYNHYERGMSAHDSKRFDEAIKALDECLCANPERLLEVEAYYNLSAIIWEKFQFNNRRGADISDDEFRWVQGCNVCLRRALKIYESLPRERQLENGLIHLHQAIKASLSPTISYGAIVYRYGQREFRSVYGLPPLRCLTEIQMRID